MRIYRVLMDREEWLDKEGYRRDHKMTYNERGLFLKWIMEEFCQSPIEARLIADARLKHKSDREIKMMVRSHWQLEKQRRAGSSQVWELLSFKGDFCPDYLKKALESKTHDCASEPVVQDLPTEVTTRGRQVKKDFRYGKMLQHREGKDPDMVNTLRPWEQQLLKEAKDGTLKRKVNTAVIQAGRGRLRGENDNDYVDIGTNRDRGVVNQILDGKRLKPDTSRFDYD